jgi:hypothetical protein
MLRRATHQSLGEKTKPWFVLSPRPRREGSVCNESATVCNRRVTGAKPNGHGAGAWVKTFQTLALSPRLPGGALPSRLVRASAL